MKNSTYIIAITGGIGSGKSVISHMLNVMGYQVYDCDKEAKNLMDNSESIKKAIADEIGNSCVTDGMINRKAVSDIVFASDEKLTRLNNIVHGAVRSHLAEWIAKLDCPICFVETAILYQSGLDKMADEVWIADAPMELRITRVMKRNGMAREDVEARIKSQEIYHPEKEHPCIHYICNDGDTPILPQVESLICQIESRTDRAPV